eukprot:m.973483 g.973483  ORF g.973483 m.973483 type:complete len:657 (+) comp23935_c2_seq16:133-2103(+)
MLFDLCGRVAFLCVAAGTMTRDCHGAASPEQVHVDVNLLWQLGNSLSVDRAKYFNIASAPWSNDWNLTHTADFALDFRAHLGRVPSVTQMMSQLQPTSSGYINASALSERCSAHPKVLNTWPKDNVEMITMALPITYYASFNSTGFVPADHNAAAEMWSLYLRYCTPSWQKRFLCEVINEPTTQIEKCNTTWQEMIDLHVAIAQRIHQDFNRSVYLVGGPTEAYPSYDVRDFTLWNKTLRPFIDQAADSMDFLSVHLYDTYEKAAVADDQPDQLNYTGRTGSNIDALLDLADAYSRATKGKVLPHLISEFGSGFKENGFAYHPLHDWYIIRGVGGKIMQFLLRPDTIMKAVPYVLGSASWDQHGVNPSPYALWHIDGNGSYVRTHLWKLYAFFKDVDGDYVYCNTSNVNVQAVVVRLGSNYSKSAERLIVLHNLYHLNVSVTVFLSDAVRVVSETRLFWDVEDKIPQLVTRTSTEQETTRERITIPVTLTPGEMRSMRVVSISNRTQLPTVVEHTLYCIETIVPISGALQSFRVGSCVANSTNNLQLRSHQDRIHHGTLKLSVSVRDDASTLNAIQVLVNGNNISVDPSRQLTSKRFVEQSTNTFFGTLRIPIAPQYFDFNATGCGAGQTIEVQFPRAGGYISSILMLVGITSDNQ